MSHVKKKNDRTVDRENVQDIWALTPMQEGMLYHYNQSPGSRFYFEQLDLSLSGRFEPDVFEQAWNDVVENNPVLRAVFRWEDVKQPVQVILKSHRVEFYYYDLSSEPKHSQYARTTEIKQLDRERGFDLTEVPFRVTLCRFGSGNGCMIVSSHHILFDGWSNGILLSEFFRAYRDRLNGILPQLAQKPLFKHYIRYVLSPWDEGQKEFWKCYLGDIKEPTDLPVKKTGADLSGASQQHDFQLERQRLLFPIETRTKAEAWSKTNRVTLAALLYGVWGLLLQRYADSGDVVFGTTISGRTAPLAGIRDMVGLLINTLPLRVRAGENENALDMVRRLAADLQRLESYSTASLASLKDVTSIPGDREFFDSLVVIENYPLDHRLTGGKDAVLSIDSYRMEEMTHFDLTLAVLLFDTIDIHFLYPRGRFDDTVMISLAHHFNTIFAQILDNPSCPVSQMDMTGPGEKKQILEHFNDTDAQFPTEKTIHSLFQEQVQKYPKNEAIVWPRFTASNTAPGTLTYEELDRRANIFAGILRRKGIIPGAIAAIMMERSIEMMIAIFGTLKAGAAYLPIDPDYPTDRIDYIIKDSGTKLILTVYANRKDRFVSCPPHWPDFLLMDGGEISETVAPYNDDETDRSGTFSMGVQLAYVIYTSGSTGRPKGVMVEHGSVVNLLYALSDKFPLITGDTYLLKTPFLFDVSVSEIFGFFMNGGRLALLEPGAEKEPRKIVKAVHYFSVTHINFVPSLFYAFVDHLHLYNDESELIDSLKYCFLAGEALLSEPVQRFRQLPLNSPPKLENLYGPTEATVYASGFSLENWQEGTSIPIGAPLANMRLYILSSLGHVQPVGVPGELFIAGAGLARGYLNQPELTARSFLYEDFYQKFSHGLNVPSSVSGGGFYRTGDLVRWLPDGNIEFLGRIDRQVKVRGFRIELGEIENCLVSHDLVKEAVVITGDYGDGDLFLCAYVVLRSGADNGGEKHEMDMLKNDLADSLPEYMVPSFFIPLQSVPLTPSGKVDRRSLPLPAAGNSGQFTAPRDETELKLAELWKEVLGIDSADLTVGIDENFFRMGGHSLKAARLISRINKTFDVQLLMDEFFNHPTIRQLRHYLASLHKEKYTLVQLVETCDYYPLSAPQKRLYVLHGADPASVVYNMPSIIELRGELDIERCKTAFYLLVDRHESFRTSFHQRDDEPFQVIHEPGGVKPILEFKESSRAPLDIDQLAREFVRPFDLGSAPLLRVEIVKIASTRFYLLVDMHHIISDGASIGIMVKEFMALMNGEILPLLPLQYKEYTRWQLQNGASEGMAEQETFWLEHLSGELPRLQLPYDFSRPAVMGFDGSSYRVEIDETTARALKEFAGKHDATLYMVLMAVFNIWLSRLSGQEDIIVGTVAHGRKLIQWQPIVGFFINTMAIRHFPEGTKTVGTFVKEVKNGTLAALQNQEYPFDRLVDKLDITRERSGNPVFDVMFTLQNMDVPELVIPGLTLVPYSYRPPVAKFDLTVIAVEQHGGKNGGDFISLEFEYNTALFKPCTIERFATYFLRLAAQIPTRTDTLISDLEILDDEEKLLLVETFNATSTQYPKDIPIHQLFSEQAQKTPDRTAAVCRRERVETFSYRFINQQSEALAEGLMAEGIAAGSIVALMLERSVHILTCLLGVLKTGAAYLPIESDTPRERVTYMLTDSKASLLITDAPIGPNSGTGTFESKCPIRFVDQIVRPTIPVKDPEDRRAPVTAYPSLAYIIYTSGSTGKPKGVMVDHHNIVRLVKNTDYIEFRTGNRLLQTGSLAFDASTFEIWGALTNGLELYLLEKSTFLLPEDLKQAVYRFGIDVFFMTTALFNQLCETDVEIFAPLRYLLTGGDVQSAVHQERIRSRFPSVRLISCYGPTENTTFSTTFPVNRQCTTFVPIGKPITNSTAYVIDRYNRISPVGVAGELWVGGEGVARGYLNRPELTAEKFVDVSGYEERGEIKNAPWRGATLPKQSIPVRRLYKTGDLCRWADDGNLEFLGRIDQQVKIRGFRIEPGEIETRLLELGEVGDVIVVPLYEKDRQRYLCAYVVPVKEVGVAERHSWLEGVKRLLSEVLPSYMVPDRWVIMDKLPLTPNGKVNRRLLPPPKSSGTRSALAPRNEIESKVAEFWREILGFDSAGDVISIDDNFFNLGGHSLKATQLVSRIRKTFDITVTLAEFFKNSTIRQLSEVIRNGCARLFKQIVLAEDKEYYPLSSTQERFFMLQQMERRSIAYNIPSVFSGSGHLDRDVFYRAMRQLLERHESLRTSFRIVGGNPVQCIHPVSIAFQIEYFDLPGKCNDEAVKRTVQSFVKPFDLASAPLMRLAIAKWEGETDSYLLLFDIHHIISDGSSIGNIVKELSQVLSSPEISLPSHLIRYRDFVVWQRERLNSGLMVEEETYWLEVFSAPLPVLELPLDYPRPNIQNFAGAALMFKLDGLLAGNIHRLLMESGMTLYMALLAALNIQLGRYSNLEDIIIGSPIAGRNHPDLEPIVGLFIETLVTRNYPSPGKSLTTFLDEIKESTLAAYENQDYPFRELVRNVADEKDLSRNPLFDVMLMVQNIDIPSLEAKDLKLEPYSLDIHAAKVDITLEVHESKRNGEPEILCVLEYATSLFKHETMNRFKLHFIRVLEQMVAMYGNAQLCLSDIDLLSRGEKQQIIEEFNKPLDIDFETEPVDLQFERQVVKTPDSVALIRREGTGSVALTYAEVNREAESIASLLRQSGIGRETVIAIMVDRSIEMITGLLGILKSGGAYLPVDAEYPDDRIAFMLADSQTPVILVNAKTLEQAKRIERTREFVNIDIIDIAQIGNSLENSPQSTGERVTSDLAYIIYTSGSTGRPKGVMVEHRNLSTYIETFNRQIPFYSHDIVIQQASYSFDTFGEEVYPILLTGGRLVIPESEDIRDINRLWNTIKRFGVTVIDCSPLLLSQINRRARTLRTGPGIRIFISGGDALKGEHIDYLIQSGTIYNTYGPTESTICATFHRCTTESVKMSNVPIGRPFSNYRVYILSPFLKLQPIGAAGELCVSGPGVTRGYLNNVGMTADRFLSTDSTFSDSFGLRRSTTSRALIHAHIYKTGDKTRWLFNGLIEFLGRIDKQIKIRGYRIEPGEIERQLNKFEGISEAVVLARKGEEGEYYLCAYFVAAKVGESFGVAQVREFLTVELPSYMIPSYFVEIKAIPYTLSGKLDTGALPDVSAGLGSGTDYEPPDTDTEKKLAAIWSEHLRKPIEQIGVMDNFFDLGGQSIIAMRMAAELRVGFGVDVPLVAFFREGNIRTLGRLIERLEARQGPGNDLGDPTPDHSLSRARLTKRKRKKISL